MASLEEPKFIGQEWGGQRGIDNFLKGFSLMASLSAKRRATENQIAAMGLREQMAEWKQQKDQEQLAQGAEKIQDLERFHAIEGETQKLREQRQQNKYEDSQKQTQADTQRLIDMQGKVYGIQAKRGTTDYQKQFDDIKDEYSDITGSAEAKRILSPLEKQHKDARGEGFKAFNNQVASLGIDPKYAPALFGTPEMWQQGDDPKTGNMKFQVGAVSVAIPKPRYDQLKKKYSDFYDLGAATVKPDDHANEWQKAKSAMGSRDPLQVKKLYQSKGYDPTELDSDTAP